MNFTHCVDYGSRGLLGVTLVPSSVNRHINNSEQNLYEGQVLSPSEIWRCVVASVIIVLGMS